MSLFDGYYGGGNTNFSMPIAPAYGSYGNGNGGFGFGGDGAWWLLVLFLFAANGNGFVAGNNGAMPYLMNNNTNNDVQRGFDQSAVMNGINGLNAAVTGGFADTQQALCSGFAGVNQAIASGFANAEVANNSRQMANMQQQFANQTAMNSGFNSLQSQLAQCCCDNRLATANLTSTILAENCADRAAVSDGIRDILVNSNNNTQKIIDMMCQDKIDAKNEKIAELQQKLTMAELVANNNNQTAVIQAGQRSLANEIEQYVLPTAKPAYIVQNPNCCQGNYGYGCNCA
jgi:hypothetical protein